MEVEVVSIATSSGPAEVDAVIIGPLIAHRTTVGGGEGIRVLSCDSWTVSHRATGYAVKAGLTSWDQAVSLAKALRSLDWNFDSPRDPKLKALGPQVKAIFDKVLGEGCSE